MAEVKPADGSSLVKVVANLIQRTQDGSLVWEAVGSNLLQLESEKLHEDVEIAFAAPYKGKRLLLTVFKEPPSINSRQSFGIWGSSFANVLNPRRIELSLADWKNRPLWTFPQVSGLSDLYNAIGYKVAGVSDFLNDILQEDLVDDSAGDGRGAADDEPTGEGR